MSIKYIRVRTNSPPWITQEIVEAINDRNLLFNNGTTSSAYRTAYDIDCSEEDIVFTCSDILRVVNNIDIHKSSGIDFLPTFILKDCFMVILDQLVYLFNHLSPLALSLKVGR